jgi:predicted nuclease of predicted toxin-antitoxin system
MNILVDENIPNVTVAALRALDHDVLDIRGTDQEGSDDVAVWALAQAESRTLVTTDKGFVEHRSEDHAGLLVVRLRQPNEDRIHARIMAAFTQFAPNEWRGLTVVMRDTVQSVTRAETT